MFIGCCDGLKGFPEAIEAVYPKTIVQTCIVHMIRSSTRFVSYRDRKRVTGALKPVYTAPTREAAEAAVEAFDNEWKEQHPIIGQSWRRNWERIVSFLDFPADIRKAIYTTNAIESINSQIRKLIKNRGHFPNDEAAIKLIHLALINAEKRWSKPIRHWKRALNQFAIRFECTSQANHHRAGLVVYTPLRTLSPMDNEETVVKVPYALAPLSSVLAASTRRRNTGRHRRSRLTARRMS